MTVRHVALFWFRPGVDPERVADLTRGLAALPGQVPEIERYAFGADLRLREGNADYAVVADLPDGAAFDRYQAHPAHVALLDGLLRPILDRRAAVQLEL